ncbi:ribosomal protein S7 [Daedalea quercina L-15889]|uniref:Ribosomal protein S7 n=1 Tax=Daedalea quercina L-15889 TaxID=1314783 RepID=A0A165R755_9APHY|nr:ribosomal protein S7 [Daedalea quercina L-15889]
MLSSLRQIAARTRLVPRRGFSSSFVAANSEEAGLNGIVDRETLLPVAALPTALPTPEPARRAALDPLQPTIRIPPQYDPLLELLAGSMMRTGRRRREPSKKAKGRKIVSDTLLTIHAQTRAPPLPILRRAIELASPSVRMVSFWLPTGRWYTPRPLSERQRAHKGIRWILQASELRKGKVLAHRLAQEMIAIVEGAGKENMRETSLVYKLKEELHKMAVMHRGNMMKPPPKLK